jgi:carbon-monoxide dehydrogenase large subunit
VITGSQPHGQGHVTVFSQIVAEELGIDMDRIEVLHSESKGMIYAQGSYGSRTFSVEGPTIYNAVQQIKQKACKLGAHLLKVEEEAVIYADGAVRLRDAPDNAIKFADIALALWYAWDLPPGMEPGLEALTFFDPEEFNFPFGTHIAIVEIDEQTAQVDLVRYIAVDDVGNVGNPLIVEGQMHGNITFGIGQALLEEAVFDQDGQLATDGFDDYAVPRASMLPHYELDRTVTPTPHNPLGAKGAGDVSNPAVPPAIANAICDALADLGVRHLDTPVTPEKIWNAMQASPHGLKQ